MKDCEQIAHDDLSLGFGVFRKGVSFETLKKAVDRHNEIYKALIKNTPNDQMVKIIEEVQDKGK